MGWRPVVFRCGTLETPHPWACLPHITKQLATQPLGARLAVAHDAAARADDGNAHALQDGLQFLVAAIKPQARLRRALNTANDAFAVGAVLQEDAQEIGRAHV